MNAYPNLTLMAYLVAMLLLAVVLTGCNGFPRYNPGSCSTIETATGAAPLWECD